MSVSAAAILAELKGLKDPAGIAEMSRFGVAAKKPPGLSVVQLRAMAKKIRGQDSRAARWIAADALRELTRWKPR